MRLILAAWPGADAELDLAIAADPDFALAHAARARVHALNPQPRQAHERVAAARSLAARSEVRARAGTSKSCTSRFPAARPKR